MRTIIESTWEPKKCKLTTKLKGQVTLADVEKWKNGLSAADALVDRPFKFIFDNYNFHAESLEVHKAYREFVPKLLARHGLILSLLTNEEKQLIAGERDKSLPACKAMALVHHYQFKMQRLDSEYKTQNQRYFYKCKDAQDWINNYPINCIH